MYKRTVKLKAHILPQVENHILDDGKDAAPTKDFMFLQGILASVLLSRRNTADSRSGRAHSHGSS